MGSFTYLYGFNHVFDPYLIISLIEQEINRILSGVRYGLQVYERTA